jgi:hypothetical protein
LSGSLKEAIGSPGLPGTVRPGNFSVYGDTDPIPTKVPDLVERERFTESDLIS